MIQFVIIRKSVNIQQILAREQSDSHFRWNQTIFLAECLHNASEECLVSEVHLGDGDLLAKIQQSISRQNDFSQWRSYDLQDHRPKHCLDLHADQILKSGQFVSHADLVDKLSNFDNEVEISRHFGKQRFVSGTVMQSDTLRNRRVLLLTVCQANCDWLGQNLRIAWPSVHLQQHFNCLSHVLRIVCITELPNTEGSLQLH